METCAVNPENRSKTPPYVGVPFFNASCSHHQNTTLPEISAKNMFKEMRMSQVKDAHLSAKRTASFEQENCIFRA